jgi:hypothetical protein
MTLYQLGLLLTVGDIRYAISGDGQCPNLRHINTLCDKFKSLTSEYNDEIQENINERPLKYIITNIWGSKLELPEQIVKIGKSDKGIYEMFLIDIIKKYPDNDWDEVLDEMKESIGGGGRNNNMGYVTFLQMINDIIVKLDEESLYTFERGILNMNMHRCADVFLVFRKSLDDVWVNDKKNLVGTIFATAEEILSHYGRKFAALKKDGWLVLDGCGAMDTIGPFLKNLIAKNVHQNVDGSSSESSDEE